MPFRRRLASLVRAAFQLEPCDAHWLEELHHLAQGIACDGVAYAYAYELRPGRVAIGAPVLSRSGASFFEALAAWGETNASVIASMYAAGATGTLRDAVHAAQARGFALTPHGFERHGVRDVVTIAAHQAGRGVVINLPSARPISFAPRDARALVDAASLLALAIELRRARVPPCGHAALSPRETEVAARVARGARDVDIAAALGVSSATIAAYVRRVCAKLGVRRREQVAAFDPSPEDRTNAADARARLASRLSAAERAVLAAVVRGESSKAIARTRGTSPRTVEAQIASSFAKCGAASRAELVRAFWRPS